MLKVTFSELHASWEFASDENNLIYLIRNKKQQEENKSKMESNDFPQGYFFLSF